MKTLATVVLGISLTGLAQAEFRTWTRSDGKTAELELISASGGGADRSGEFKMRNGRTVNLKASALAPQDLEMLNSWKSSESTAAAATPETPAASVFDKFLDGNLVKLNGKSLKTCRDATKPSKYYLFYYTASWCAPCQAFTPSLVEFYNKNKSGNDEFELVLVTSDSDEDAMEGYAKAKNMPWPQLKMSRVERFKKEFKHPGTGIPNLVLTDLDGKLLKTSYVDGNYVGPASVMNYLGSILKK